MRSPLPRGAKPEGTIKTILEGQPPCTGLQRRVVPWVPKEQAPSPGWGLEG